MSPRWRYLAVAVAVAAATFAVYGSTLSYGFRYDDYFLFRPWPLADLAGVWTGSWDPTGISVPFYRPLTAWWYATNFWLFGVNTWMLHAISLALHFVCAILLYRFLQRERVPEPVAAFGSVLYAVHPVLVYAQTAWLTNQMHALASVAVLIALLAWQRARTRGARSWLALPVIALVAFLIKEDTIMLLPALGVLTLLRRLMVERDAGPPLWQLAVAGLAAVGLFAGGRYLLLGALGGYGGAIDSARAWDLYQRGLQSALRLTPWRRPWQATAGTIATAALVLLPASVLLWKRTSRGVFVGAAGLALVLVFNVPFVLVSKAEQYHLLALGATILAAGVADALWSALKPWLLRAGLAGLFVVTLIAFGAVARDVRGDFAPCHPLVLDTDPKWWVVPIEVQAWMDRKAEACRRGIPVPALDQLPRISWGVHAPEVDEAGTGFQWTAGESVFFLRKDQDTFIAWIRDRAARPDTPRHAILTSGSGRVDITLASPDWVSVTMPVSGRLSWLRGMRKVVLTPEHSFVPKDIDPASQDTRRLALQIRFDPPR